MLDPEPQSRENRDGYDCARQGSASCIPTPGFAPYFSPAPCTLPPAPSPPHAGVTAIPWVPGTSCGRAGQRALKVSLGALGLFWKELRLWVCPLILAQTLFLPLSGSLGGRVRSGDTVLGLVGHISLQLDLSKLNPGCGSGQKPVSVPPPDLGCGLWTSFLQTPASGDWSQQRLSWL